MARYRKNNNGNTSTRSIWNILDRLFPNGSGSYGRSTSKRAVVGLSVVAGNSEYGCVSSKRYTDKTSIEFEVSDGDSFTTISSFSKTKSALTVHNSEVILIKNISQVGAEIAITTYDWRNDGGADATSDTTTDVMNSVDINAEATGGGASTQRTWTMILPSNEFVYLPTSKFISYAPYDANTKESAANAPAGQIEIEPKSINSGNEHVAIKTFSGTTYLSGTNILIAEALDATETAIDVDDAAWFEVGDTIRIDSEIVKIESIASNTLTVQRGMDGSVAATHVDDSATAYSFHNAHLKYDNGKCQTDGQGRMTNYGAFYGYARADGKIGSGLVKGSVVIGPFYSRGGYLDFGLTDIKASDDTGLTAGTTYTFHIVVDEYAAGGVDGLSSSPDGETAIAFTVDSVDTTFNGSSSAVIPKIQARFDELFYASPADSALSGKKVKIFLRNGDIRIESLTNNTDTRIGIANISGTSPFSVGRFPVLSSGVPVLKGSSVGGGTTDTIVYGPASSLGLETITDKKTGKESPNYAEIIHDDGNGNLIYNGGMVGWIEYDSGHHSFTCPYPFAEYKIRANALSAHSGTHKYVVNGYNGIHNIAARSVNSLLDTKIELTLLG